MYFLFYKIISQILYILQSQFKQLTHKYLRKIFVFTQCEFFQLRYDTQTLDIKLVNIVKI